MKRLSKHEKQTVVRMSEIRELLGGFGLVLAGYDPGITAYIKKNPNVQGDGWAREPISFNHHEWEWLEPLLKELRELRLARQLIAY